MTDLPKIDWREPGQRREASVWDPYIAALRGRPGAWGMLKAFPSQAAAVSAASHLRRRYPECEFTARRVDNGEGVASGELFGRVKAAEPSEEAQP